MNIPELLAKRQPVFSFEFFLPKTQEKIEEFLSNMQEFKKLGPAFVSLTYGAGGSQRALTVETAGRIQNQAGIETACHLSCIAHTRDEIQAILAAIAAAGITHLVALRGDLPKDGMILPPERRDFRYGKDLVEFTRARGGFSIAVAGYPQTHPEAATSEEDLLHLAEKVKAGADWVITQLFFDNSYYFDFVRRARAIGIKVPIVPGLMPVTSLSQLDKFTTLCGISIPQKLGQEISSRAQDSEAVLQYGVEYATQQCRELLDEGVPGIHFYTLNRSHATAEILRRVRKF